MWTQDNSLSSYSETRNPLTAPEKKPPSEVASLSPCKGVHAIFVTTTNHVINTTVMQSQ